MNQEDQKAQFARYAAMRLDGAGQTGMHGGDGVYDNASQEKQRAAMSAAKRMGMVGQGAAVQIRDTPEILRQIERARELLGELSNMAQSLREKLAPAMCPADAQPTTGDSKAPTPSRSDYAEQIDGLRTQIGGVMAVIGDCLNRLET